MATFKINKYRLYSDTFTVNAPTEEDARIFAQEINWTGDLEEEWLESDLISEEEIEAEYTFED